MARNKMDSKIVAAICEALVEVCNDPLHYYSICHNFDLVIDRILLDDDVSYNQADDWLGKTIQKWPKFSGDFNYPIWDRMSTPREQFWDARDSGNLWNNSTEYGRLRWELLAFLLEEASKLEVK